MIQGEPLTVHRANYRVLCSSMAGVASALCATVLSQEVKWRAVSLKPRCVCRIFGRNQNGRLLQDVKQQDSRAQQDLQLDETSQPQRRTYCVCMYVCVKRRRNAGVKITERRIHRCSILVIKSQDSFHHGSLKVYGAPLHGTVSGRVDTQSTG